MRRQQGFSLIEVMVTMVIVSIGLLGIAGIIVTNMKNNQSSHARSQASALVNDIVDRMRANRSAAESGAAPYRLPFGGTPSPATGVAADDLTAWKESLKTLPSGDGSVLFQTNGNVTVTIQWDDRRATGNGATVGIEAQQFVLETHL